PTATLTWTDAASNETGYRVEILDGETWTLVQELAADANEWTTDVQLGATYTYRVVAVNAYGETASESVEVALEAASTIVTTDADVVDPTDGETSLREAIQLAKSGATVSFAETLSGATFTLAGTELKIDKAIAIDGGDGVTIDADGKSRAFYIVAGTADAPVKLIGLTITGGKIDGYGGGVRVSKTAILENCVVVDNTANFGGGVYVDKSGVAIVDGTTLSGNSAKYGAALFVNGQATLTNVEIADNAASIQGGALYVDKSGTANATNVALTGNSADSSGGALFVAGVATLTNATVADNTAKLGAAANVASTGTATFRNSIVVDAVVKHGTANAYNTASNFADWTNADAEGVVNYVLDEGDVLFAEGSYALAADSVALNKGDDAYLDATTDLAGNPRFNGTVDLGAYESQAPLAPTGLTATVEASTAPTATLTWTDAASNETGYRVEILDGETWTLVEELAADANEWSTDVQLGATYTYRVVAVNAHGETASESVVFTVGDVPAQPTDLTA
ncbi:MAG: hypothetical protein IJY15_12600, partial [Thermoguttaceae bacterium]|nr:hypothetical protein [Thermoguttaceae bacterium]